ncbi:MAG: autotransporter domain-containing protein [Candidatus Omnitrophota bacterium]|jgi:hypothetical protein
MKRIVLPLFLVVAIATWPAPSFAARQMVIADAQLDAGTGGLDGVEITGAVTLSVGVAGGPKFDIFTNNLLLNSVDPAVEVTGANDSSMVTFNVSSSVYGDMGQATTGVLHSITVNDGTIVDFLKSVYSTDLFVGGTGTANLKGGATSTNTVRMQFTGVGGTISIDPNTLVTGALTTTGGDDTGTLSLGSGSQLTGAVGALNAGIHSITVVGGSSAQPPSAVSATITGAVLDVHSFFLGTNTLNIAGALTIATNGEINTTLASSTVYGKIVVAAGNVADLGTGLTVRVTVPTTSLLMVGDRFEIVQSTAGLNALATVDPTNSLYTFTIDTTATAGDATIVVLTVPAQIPIVNPPANPVVLVAVPVAEVLTNIVNPGPDLAGVIAAVNALTDPNDVVEAEAQLSPLAASLVVPLVTYQGAREFQNLWLSRLDACRQVSWPSKDNSNCKGSGARSGWWQKGFGYFGNQNDRGAFKGYDSKIIGTMLAYDVPLGLDTRAGLGVGYARSIIDGTTYDINTDFDTYQATAYIGHDQGPWFVHGSGSFGWNEYAGRRHIVFPGVDRTAHSDYSGQDYTAFANTGYRISVQKFTITPIASLQYSRVNISGYTEKNAGDVNLKVESQRYDYLESGLGGKVERDFSYRGWAFVPEVHFEWLHKLSNPALKRTAEFTGGGAAFTTPGLQTVADMYHAGTGLTLLACACSATRWSLEGSYDYYWRVDGYSANQATMRVTARF